jgi:hypothetical protein
MEFRIGYVDYCMPDLCYISIWEVHRTMFIYLQSANNLPCPENDPSSNLCFCIVGEILFSLNDDEFLLIISYRL